MKKLLALITLTFTLTLVFGVVANAEEPIDENGTNTPLQERMTDFKEQRVEKAEERQAAAEEKRAQAEERQANFMEQIAANAPAWTDDFEEAFEAHEAVHVILKETNQIIKEAYQAEAKAAAEALKADLQQQLEDGTLTKEEARTLAQSLREEIKADRTSTREEVKALVEALKADMGLTEEARQALHTALKEAIASGDEAAIDTAVEDVYYQLLTHIEFDEAKVALLMDYFSELF